MPKTGVLLAFVTGVIMALAGASPWLALAVVLIWIGSLWLSRPAPAFEHRRDRSFTVSRETIAPFIEPLGVPLLLLDAERIVAANKAARDALGEHISGQDARVALRHPEAIELLSNEVLTGVTIQGLTTARSIWQLSRFRIDSRFRLIEFVNRTADADISRAHTDFVANASHELRTPLASIIGYLETLQDSSSNVDTATREKFQNTMHSEARRMQSLVEDLMSLSRIEAEKHSAPRERLNIKALIQSVTKDVAEINGADRISYSTDESDPDIFGERGQIDQLVRNLIDNALKYGDADKKVSVTLASKGGAAVLSVEDKGAGIPSDHLPHLTRRFYRTDPARSRSTGGTGLGLAIVKHIVERHRGQLDITSREGIGTTVTVQIPLAKPLANTLSQ
jgi:two-component system, OmpR family, phosphate regulon sensor histidine kinase PhoR